MLEWLVAGGVYAAAALSGMALPLVRAPIAVLVALLSVLALTPFGYIEAPPFPPLTYLEVFVAAGAGATLVQYAAHRAPLSVPGFLLVFAGYYLLRVLVDLGVEGSTWFSYLRDARPIANLVAIVILGETLRRDSIGVRPRAIVGIATLAIGVDAAIYLGGARLGMTPAGIAEEFLARTGVLRYSDELTVTLYGFLTYAFFLERRTTSRVGALILMAVISVLSLNRVFILFVIVNAALLAHDVVRDRTGSRVAALGVVTTCLVCLVLVGVVAVGQWIGSDSEALARWLDLTSASRLLAALVARFVAPALDGGFELNALTALFGAGPSFLFYIPWFEYRGLEAYHASVDSFFFAAFVKYGLVGVSLLTVLVARCMWRLPSRWGHAWFLAYMMVHNVIAVPAVLLFLLLSIATKSRYVIVARLSHARAATLGASIVGEVVPVDRPHPVRT